MADFTTAGLVVAQLDSEAPEMAITELANLLQREGVIRDGRAFGKEVLRREAVASTAIVPDIALPHARLAELDRPWFAFGRANPPLIWGGCLVHSVFLMAVPESDTAGYLQLLSGLARSGSDGCLSNRLAKARDNEQILEVFRGISVPCRSPHAGQTDA